MNRSYWFFQSIVTFKIQDINVSFEQESTTGTYKALGDSLLKNPKNRLSKDYLEPEIFLKKAITGRFAMVDVSKY